RENRAHGLAGGARGRRDPAARLHDEDASAAGTRQSGLRAWRRALEASQIRRQARNQISVDDYCGQALVLAELRKNLVGRGYWDPKFSQGLRGGPFIGGMPEGKQKANRDRLSSGTPDAVPQAPKFSPRGAQRDSAVSPGPLLHSEPQRARHERRLAADVQVVEPRARLAADLDQVLETLGGHERDASAPPLEQRVCPHGCAVDDLDGSPGARFCFSQEAHAFSDAASGVVGRREHLEDSNLGAVEDNAVREGAAGVHTDPRWGNGLQTSTRAKDGPL